MTALSVIAVLTLAAPGDPASKREAIMDAMRSLAAELKTETKKRPSPSTTSCRERDEHRHPFATCFDAWQGLELGGGLLIDGTGATGNGLASIRLRGERESKSKEESTWLHLHRIAGTEIRPLGGMFAITLQGYQGVFRRHVREGVVLLPFNPPVQIPFPLDLAFAAELLRYERRSAEGSDWSLEPVRLSFLLDPLRSASNRFHLSLGVTAAWRVHQLGNVLQHEVTPLTAATLFFDFESEDGLWLARGQLTGGFTFLAPDPTLSLRARGEIELSRVLFALNDQPLSLFVRGTAAWRDAGARGSSEWSAQVGLQIRLFSKR